MNAFDIPYGIIKEKLESGIHYDYTVWTSVADLKNISYSFKTYKDQSIRTIYLLKALAAAGKEIKVIEMDSKQPIEDVSTNFK